MDVHAQPYAAALKFLQTAATKLSWSARGTYRTVKIARTIAELAGAQTTQLVHVSEAMQYHRTLSR